MDLRKLLFSLLGFVVSNLVQVGLHGVGRSHGHPVPLPGNGVPAVLGQVHTPVNRDPDAGGPTRPCLVVGDRFTLARELLTLAALDPVTGTWSMSGAAPNVEAAIVLADGRLAIAGPWPRIGGLVVHGIGAFDGLRWAALGSDSGLGDPQFARPWRMAAPELSAGHRNRAVTCTWGSPA